MDLSIILTWRFGFPSIGMATAKNYLQTWRNPWDVLLYNLPITRLLSCMCINDIHV